MKDKRTGEPNGLFLDNAKALVTTRILAGGPDETERAIMLGVARSLKLGWTEVQIAGNSFDEMALLKNLYEKKRIKLRIYDAILGPGADSRRLLSEGPTIGAFDQHFTCRGIKVVFDGALGSKGAALMAKYSDYDSAGFLKWKEEDLLPTFQRRCAEGCKFGCMRSATEPITTFSIFSRSRWPAFRLRSAWCRTTAVASGARPDHVAERHPALRSIGHSAVDAAIACDQRSALCREPTWSRTARRRLCLAEFS